MGIDATEAALDELYGSSFDDFVAQRKIIAARLRAAGDADAARAVASASKPTRAAWALDRWARAQPARLAELAELRRRAASSQKSRSADAIRDDARRYREAIAEAVRETRAAAAASGVSLSDEALGRVADTLQTVAADDAQRALLARGRLVEDATRDDPFAALEGGALEASSPRVHVVEEPLHGRRKGPNRPDRENEEREARLRKEKEERAARERARREALADVTAREREWTEAARAAKHADERLEDARAEAQAARRSADGLEVRLKSARAALAKLS